MDDRQLNEHTMTGKRDYQFESPEISSPKRRDYDEIDRSEIFERNRQYKGREAAYRRSHGYYKGGIGKRPQRGYGGQPLEYDTGKLTTGQKIWIATGICGLTLIPVAIVVLFIVALM